MNRLFSRAEYKSRDSCNKIRTFVKSGVDQFGFWQTRASLKNLRTLETLLMFNAWYGSLIKTPLKRQLLNCYLTFSTVTKNVITVWKLKRGRRCMLHQDLKNLKNLSMHENQQDSKTRRKRKPGEYREWMFEIPWMDHEISGGSVLRRWVKLAGAPNILSYESKD